MKETQINVRALADLARLRVTDDELAQLEKELPAILGFVETIQKASAQATPSSPALLNVMRSDDDAHETGHFTDILLSLAPKIRAGYVVVKQVVSRKK